MIYDQVKPNTASWNQVKSEFERDMKIFLLLQESPDKDIREMALKNADLIQKAFHNMNCDVDGKKCKCSDVTLVSKNNPDKKSKKQSDEIDSETSDEANPNRK